ncbi:DUF1073 domain-containing protein [Phascolarctobacterium faecium]|uniref:phage portal protein n=1 Tax=Phascolarctobacterium faecium TaxID=33025 RepID=UPI00210CE70B|nr:DUF1073 domain-containing protein [Phascolarctobacterium faecium]MCQ4905970.1 DUF1073 domain-containing protein [Phascolarctobacterium faecium]
MVKNNSKKKSVDRTDGFFNTFISRGARQYTRDNSFFLEEPLTYQFLEGIWSNRLAQRISSLPAEAALKNGYKIEGDEDNLIIQYLDERLAESILAEALTWARHFGRSCIFMIMDDGGTEEEPVNWARLRSIKSMEVYDAQSIIEDFSGYLINDDPTDKQFGKPEWYQITPPLSGRPIYIHHSRLLIFDGDLLPKNLRISRNGCGMSCLEGLIKGIYRCDTAQATALHALERMSTSLTKLNELGSKLATPHGEEEVQRRLDLIDMARNILNTIALSTDDEYQVFNVPMSGIPDVLDNFGQYICAMTGIPFTVLFGRAPAGLNSTGRGDLENYYNDVVGKVQRRQLKPQLEKLIKTVQLCKDGPTGGRELENWTIKFNPLWIPTEKEIAETNKLNAECVKAEIDTINSLMEAQLLDSSEVRPYLAEKYDLPIKGSLLNLSDDDDETE